MKNKISAIIFLIFIPLFFTGCIPAAVASIVYQGEKSESKPLWEKGTVTVSQESNSVNIKITTTEGHPLSYTLIKTNSLNSFDEIKTISTELETVPLTEVTFTLPENAKGLYYIAVEFYKSSSDDGSKINLITETLFTEIIRIY